MTTPEAEEQGAPTLANGTNAPTEPTGHQPPPPVATPADAAPAPTPAEEEPSPTPPPNSAEARVSSPPEFTRAPAPPEPAQPEPAPAEPDAVEAPAPALADTVPISTVTTRPTAPPEVTFVPLAVTIGDGFKFGCGFFLAMVMAMLVGFVLLAALFVLTGAMGLSLPIGR